MGEQEVEMILDTAYSLSSCNQSRVGVSWLISHLDDFMFEGRFGDCDEVLSSAKPEKLADSLIVTILGITFGAKDKLECRSDFYRRAVEEMSKRRVDVEKLLGRYE
jgi:hypothetical protein